MGGHTIGNEIITDMEDIKALKDLLTKIRELDSVTDALLMTKTGMFVMGSMRRSRKLERFIGMSAILTGSSEATSIEMGEKLNGVIVRSNNSKVAFMLLTENIILVVMYKKKKADAKFLEDLGKLLPPI